MKKFFIAALLFSLYAQIYAQDSCIVFQNESLPELISLAQESDKLIFVDVSATWCKPCKKMEATTFKNKDVAQYFSSSFLCKKIYADKASQETDPIIMQLVNKTTSVPTLYFLDAYGRVLSKSTGYITADILIKEAKQAKIKASEEL